MSEFKRLLEDPATDDFEADLLRLARHDGPSPDARTKILAALGAGVVTASSGGAAAVAESSGVFSQASAGTGIAPAIAKSGALKWLVLGTGVLVPIALWFALSGSRDETRPLQPNVVQGSEQTATTTDKPGSGATSEPAATKLEDLPVLPSEAARGTGAGQPASEPSLADEVKVIQRAKAALSAGDASGALKELDGYHRAFPKGRLAMEATVLRIEALAASGNTAAAKKLGEQFLKNNEKSPYAARVKTVVGR